MWNSLLLLLELPMTPFRPTSNIRLSFSTSLIKVFLYSLLCVAYVRRVTHDVKYTPLISLIWWICIWLWWVGGVRKESRATNVWVGFPPRPLTSFCEEAAQLSKNQQLLGGRGGRADEWCLGYLWLLLGSGSPTKEINSMRDCVCIQLEGKKLKWETHSDVFRSEALWVLLNNN